jgi:uncharacterized membrane protein YebE (DUF533 family)
MELKPGEIVAIVIALAIPITVFAVVLTPGALGAVLGFMLDERYRSWIFFGGAAVAFGVLAFRVYRRIRPRKPPEQKPHVSPTHMPKV